jgi:hypothetical protein
MFVEKSSAAASDFQDPVCLQLQYFVKQKSLPIAFKPQAWL